MRLDRALKFKRTVKGPTYLFPEQHLSLATTQLKLTKPDRRKPSFWSLYWLQASLHGSRWNYLHGITHNAWHHNNSFCPDANSTDSIETLSKGKSKWFNQIIEARQEINIQKFCCMPRYTPNLARKASKDLTHSEELYKMFLSQAISNAWLTCEVRCQT